MIQEFDRLFDEHNDNRLGKEMMITGGIERIIIELLRKGNPSRHQQEQIQSSSIHKALSYIHQHFCQPLTSEHIASHCKVSLSYFSELFHKVTGCLFRNYLQNYRLQAAYSLTMSSNLPIIEICYASGFNSLAHFHRVFKQKYGQSPSALRKQNDTGDAETGRLRCSKP
jgi:AraC-like DNA-binding protein